MAGGPRKASVLLRQAPTSAALARSFVAETLRTWRASDCVDAALLLTSELVTNAVLHSGDVVDLLMRLDGEVLRIEVQDGDQRLPVTRPRDDLSEHGRGMTVVAALADDWGVDTSAGGKVVWCELSVSSSPAASTPGDGRLLSALTGGRLASDDAHDGKAHLRPF